MLSISKNDYEKELIILYEDFKQTYPSNPYDSYINPWIEKFKGYHAKVAGDFDKETQFVDKGSEMTTFAEVREALKGKSYMSKYRLPGVGLVKKSLRRKRMEILLITMQLCPLI